MNGLVDIHFDTADDRTPMQAGAVGKEPDLGRDKDSSDRLEGEGEHKAPHLAAEEVDGSSSLVACKHARCTWNYLL
jgi:hypothetical protein